MTTWRILFISIFQPIPKSRFRNRNPFPIRSLRVPLKAGQGACLHAVVTAFTDTICQLGVTARRRGNLIEKGEIASVPSQ